MLKPDGVLRVAVPNLRTTVNDYVAKGNADVFMDQLQLALDKPRGIVGYLRYFLIGDRNHHWAYDGPSIGKLLADNGFDRVTLLEPGQTGIQEPGSLDLFERAGGSAYAEAVPRR